MNEQITQSYTTVTNDAADYKDVDIYVQLGSGEEWVGQVSLDKQANKIIDDATPRYAPTLTADFEQRLDAPEFVLAEFARLRPEALSHLQ